MLAKINVFVRLALSPMISYNSYAGESYWDGLKMSGFFVREGERERVEEKRSNNKVDWLRSIEADGNRCGPFVEESVYVRSFSGSRCVQIGYCTSTS